VLPLDLYTLSQLLDGGPTPTTLPPQDGRSLTATVLAYSLLFLVVALMVVLGLAYVVLGARLDTPTAWAWMTTALIVFVVHAALFDPLRILLVAFYWTVFRHQLMP